MRRKDLTVPNIDPSNADYPFGKIRNDEGSGDGTPVVEELYGDIHETITAIVKDSQVIIPNGLPDNPTNGYQIFEAMFQVPTKHNIVYDFETNEDNKFVVNEHISNLKPKEYMVLNFVGTDDKQNVMSVDRIIDKSGSEFQCFPAVDFNGNFISNTRYFIERYNSNSFRIYPIVSLSLLSDLYERLEALEMVSSGNMVAFERGSFIDETSRDFGVITIPHGIIDVSNTKIIFTCTRATPSTSVLGTEFTFLMLDRTINSFRITFSNFPTNSGADRLRVDWWIVKN